jgi:light-regulated signal transduction histidine kinase (bacteriophytochrome)
MPVTDLNGLEQCEKEPLANSGLIQPNGVLLFIEKVSGQVRYVSDNAATLLGQEPDELLDLDGKDWLEQILPDLVSWPASAGRRMHFPAAVDLGFGEVDVLISGTSAGWLIEFEASQPTSIDFAAIRLARPQGSIDAIGLQVVRQNLVDAIAQTTGYDRVMLYQFHHDWSGEVLAEAADEGKGSYLGLRFPATDIPAIARNLYAQTPYRHIPDSSAAPVAIKTRVGTAAALDLTWSDLRSVSPVHMQYLANMNVLSSFSTSIMMDGKLWGLIASHDDTAKVIPLAAREKCKELASEFVQVLSDYRTSVQRDLYQAVVDVVEPIRGSLAIGSDVASAIGAQHSAIMGLTGATSAALFVGDAVTTWGAALASDTLQTIHDWCLKFQADPVFCLDDLPAKLETAQSMPQSCGVLGLSMRAKAFNNSLVSLYVFRPEEAGEIAWAGNPNKPAELAGDGKSLSPRSSFDKWIEVRTGHSRAWEEDARFAGQQLRELLSTSL